MVEQMAGQRLAPGPGEGPIGRRQAALGQIGFGRLPERHDLACQMQTNFRHQRRGDDDGLGQDEVEGVQHRGSRFISTERLRFGPVG